MKRLLPLLALAAFLAPVSRAAVADVTGLAPTIWWDFETQPSASELPAANKGSASVSFTSEGTVTYRTGVTNGWAVDTAQFTPYSGAGTFSTAGGSFTVSLVMTLGTTQNGITWNLRNGTASKDLVIRRGTSAGSLLVGVGPQAQASTDFLEATFADGDAAWHLVSVVVEPAGMSLYVDGALADSTTAFTFWSASGYASQMQFGSHLNGPKTPEVRGGGLVDDFRIHDAALTPLQILAIANEYGFASPDGYVGVRASGETTVGTDSFRTPFHLILNEDDAAEAAIVFGTDAALSAPITNVVGSALPAGSYAASLSGLASGTAYWWKIVASNGVNRAETPVVSFRTLDVLIPTDFTKRIPITVSGYNGTETLTDFPVLVRLAADSPEGFDYGECATDGSDLRFAAADGTMLPHEIESWDPDGASYVWVKVPALAGTATAFDLFYGADPATPPAVDPTGVWTRYVVVIHGGDALANAVGNGLVATNGSKFVLASPAAGKAGGGIRKTDYNAVGVNVDEPTPKLSNGGRFSVSGWFRRDGNGGKDNNGTHILMANRKSWNANGEGFVVLAETGTRLSVSYKSGHTWTTGTNLVSAGFAPGDWGHVAFSYDKPGSRLVSYLNGIRDNETNRPNNLLNSDSTLAHWTFGSFGNSPSADSFRGDMDELRVFDGFASDDWIRAEHDTVADPAAFAVAGAARPTNPDAPRFGACSATVNRSDATFSVSLSNVSAETAVSLFYGTAGSAALTEIPLGTLSADGTLTATATGLDVGTYVWYARATATVAGVACSPTSGRRDFAVTYAKEPTASYKHFTATLSHAGTPAADVPVLLRLSEDAIDGFRYADVTETGFECIDDAGNLLPWEIDTWDTNGVSLLWVKVPSYADGATVTVRYGGAFANARPAASEVWSGYVGVWHMSEASGGIMDATGHALDATPMGNTENSVALSDGPVGNARQTATSAEKGYLSIPNYDRFGLGGTFTMSGWVKLTACTSYPRLFSRKANYTDANGWEIEMSNGSSTAFGARGSGNSPSYSGTFGTALNTAWSHVVLAYDGATLTVYQNGVQAKTGAITAATDNGLPLSIGCDSDGSETYAQGAFDECRLMEGAASADRISAEYAAMADTNAVSYGAVVSVEMGDPRISPPIVERLSNGTFRVTAEISQNEPVAGSVKCVAGQTEFTMTTSDTTLPATYTALLSGLAAGTYTATVQAESAGGNIVSRTGAAVFHAGALSVTGIADADETTLSPGILRIARADADPTGLSAVSFDVAFSGDGLDAIETPSVTTLTIPSGESFVDVSVTPIYTTAVDADTTLTLTVSGAFIGTPSSGSIIITNAIYDPAVRYVATTGDDANHGGTPELPKKTIGAAIASLAHVVETLPGTVHVAPGLYPISSPISLANAIHVLGDDPDPSRTVVSNTFNVNWDNQNKRVFSINHTGALVANLTMQKGQYYYSAHGGNFYIGSAGGTVSNCVVEAGATSGNAQAAGALLDGGLVTHSVFRKNRSNSGTAHWDGKWKGVLYLKGASRAENCLFVDNSHTVPVVLIALTGSSVMRNCTIADTRLEATNAYCNVFAALNIESQNATVQNVVVAGVTNGIDGAACALIGNVARFQNGAFDGDATGLPAGTVTGAKTSFFRNCAEGDYRPSLGGPLTGKGANYEGMAAVDLSGRQKRLIGKQIDIGAYEANTANTVLILK